MMRAAMNRRGFLISTAATGLLSACGGPGGFDAVAPSAPDPAMRPVANAGFDAWVSGFKGRAVSAGINQGVVDRAFARAGFIPGVIERDRNQAEFKRSFEDYLSLVASEKKVAMGRSAFASQRGRLNAIEAKYGVPAEICCAIWGVESTYGTRRGDIPVISACATLAYEGRRGAFFEKQLIAALKILQAGDTTPERMVGSWAGAMGHTQFIPTSFQLFAVDFTGDGRRDIWSDDPSDALASTAAYLARNGWRRGERWGSETTSGGLQPDPGGPRFAVGHNFNVIKRYNNSDNYALAVGYLSDRIAGRGGLQAEFGPDRYGLTQRQRMALQEGLTRAGFDAGTPDGVLGNKTAAAIRGYQQANGLPVTGEPSLSLLQRLA
ncbi:lytic murein transglycosylase [Vannielia sp.]|uniref:lytic murein transglycosylase n=2 Tax=Rhodobacterales TaxID=204455 RepID=UPI003BABF0FF